MKPRILPWIFCLSLGSAAGFAGASEADYRLAEDLLKRANDRQQALEQVQRLAEQHEHSPVTSSKLEGLLIRALLVRWQAKSENGVRRTELLSQAKKLYEAFEAQGKDHPLLSACRAEANDLQRDCARELVAAAEIDPAHGKDKRAEAAKLLGEIAERRRIVAEALRPAVEKAFKNLDENMAQHPEQERPPAHLVDAARKVLQSYIPEDKQYAVARLEQLEALDPADPVRKALADSLTAYCQMQLEWEVYLNPGLEPVAMWYGYIKGRVHAVAGEGAKAESSWQDAMSTIEALDDPAAVKEAQEIKLLIGRDFINLLLRQAAQKPARYTLAAKILDQLQRDYPALAESDAGKEVLIGGARALACQPDADKEQCEAAVSSLRKVVVLGGWGANAASRALADVLQEAKQRKFELNLSPQAWFDAAHGLFLDGQIAWRDGQVRGASGDAPGAARMQAEAQKSYEQALLVFQRVIKQTRAQAGKEPLVRLQLEPRAWFESGLCAYKMTDLPAALLAFKAVDDNFSPAARAKWLPDSAKEKAWYAKKDVKAALAALDNVDLKDAQEDGLLHASARNLMAAFQRFRALNPGQTPPVIPKGWQEEEALAGKRFLDEGNELRAAGLKAFNAGDPREGGNKCREALARFREAADLFQRVPNRDRNYEAALYQAPAAWLMAQSLANEKAFTAQATEQERQDSRENGRKALDGFSAYEAYVNANASQEERVLARRARLTLATYMGRANAHYYLQEWSKTVEACDQCLSLEQDANAETSRATDAAFLKFHALSHQADEAASTESDRYLENAQALLPALARKTEWRAYAVRNLMARYSNAVERGRKAGAKDDRLAGYYGHLADLAAILAGESTPPAFDEMVRLAHFLREAGRLREAADAAEKLVAIFDPEKKNARIDDALWPAIYERMTRLIRFDDLDKWERCKKDHLALLDLIYDTPEGATRGRKGGPALRQDQQNLDYAKALEQIATIRSNYPDCATNRPAAGATEQLLNGQSFLMAIEEEVTFRQRMLATRDMLAELALAVAENLEQAGQADAARHYRSVAAEQMEVLLETWSDTPEMKIRIARVKLANQEYDAALQLLFEVKRSVRDTSSDLYVRSAKLSAETYFAAGRFEDAAEYPRRMLALEVGDAWMAKHWPGMRGFAENCYAKGAKRPAAVPVAAAANTMDYSMATPDEKEFADLQRVYLQGQRTNDEKLLTPAFLERYEFLKGKIEHYRSYSEMERRVLETQSSLKARDLSAAFLARYEAAKALVAAESEAWRASKAYDEAIMKFGGVNQVPNAIALQCKNGFSKAAALREKFESLAKD